MAAPGLGRPKVLNNKRCWKEWANLNSLNKVSLLFEKEELINENTGRRFTCAAIEKSAFRWCLSNPEEARDDLRLWWMKEGKILDDESWNKFLAGIIRTLHYDRRNIERYNRVIEKYGLQKYAFSG